jgi:DNA polymerase (family 10)
MDKKEVAAILNDIGTALELKGENPFKVRSYYNAARNIETIGEDINPLAKEDRLREIPGVGESIAEKIKELLATGKMKYYEDLQKELPEGLFEMLRIPGMGPKKIKAIWDELGITDVAALEYACHENRIAALPHFGERSQEKILEGIAFIKKAQGRYISSEIREQAESLENALKKDKNIIRISIAGSIRRRCETSKDIDIVVSSKKPEEVGEKFAALPQVATVTAQGETKVSVILKSNVAADLRIVDDRQFPYALHHFTGSKEHNVAMRGRAEKKFSMKMNEYGLFAVGKGKGGEDKLIPCKDEAEIFQKLGLAYIEPELRENMGEIEAAEKGKLPKLIEEKDVRGVIHVHTDYSDGLGSIKEFTDACIKMGYEYMAVADHSATATYANGVDEKRLKKQHGEIDALNKKLKGFKIFKSTEVDILSDGSLDYSKDALKTFDFVIAAVHARMPNKELEMTKAVIKALENPYTSMLGHPTGRLLLAREPFKINIEKVIDACAANGVVIEINANPQRLDLDWRYVKRALEKDVKFCICPDAHRINDINDIKYGVAAARKGWATKADVVNCLPAAKFLAALKRN